MEVQKRESKRGSQRVSQRACHVGTGEGARLREGGGRGKWVVAATTVEQKVVVVEEKSTEPT